MNLLTLRQAASATDIDESTIRKHLKKGKLEGVKRKGGSWLVSATDLFKRYPSNGAPIEDTEVSPAKEQKATDTTVSDLREAIADLRKDRDAWRKLAMNRQT